MGVVVPGTCQGGVWRNEPLLHAFFLFHPTILKPDFHLCLVELKGAGDFDPSGSGQVLVEVELLLQLGQLLRREVRSSRVVDATGALLTSIAAVCFGLRNCKSKITIFLISRLSGTDDRWFTNNNAIIQGNEKQAGEIGLLPA